MNSAYDKTTREFLYDDKPSRPWEVSPYDVTYGYYDRRRNGRDYWVHADGRKEPVQQDGGGYDVPPSWVLEERRQAARLAEVRRLMAIEGVYATLARNGCDISVLSPEECRLVGMDPPAQIPVGTGADVEPVPTDLAALAGMALGVSAMATVVERDGQRGLVQSQARLPKMMDDEDRKALKKAGVKFGKVQDDGLFVQAKLPPGWRVLPTDHALWSDLVDDRGRKRASVFYKAAPWDRNASLRASCRYGIDVAHLVDDRSRGVVRDGRRIIHVTDVVRNDPIEDIRADKGKFASDKARQAAADWLMARFPKCSDPSAYW